MGGPSLAKINKCLCADGNRRTVYITSEPDTYFSIPAATRVHGKYVGGYLSVTHDNKSGCLEFTATDKRQHINRDYSVIRSLMTADYPCAGSDLATSLKHKAQAFAGFGYGEYPDYR
jgi:hypothetical protein